MQYTAAQLSLRGQHAAYARWAQEPDRRAATAPGRRGWMARFDRIVCERAAAHGWTLSPAQLAQMADAEMRAYMAGLALKRSLARTRAKAAQPTLRYTCSWCHPKTAGKSCRMCPRHAATLDAMVASVRARHADEPELIERARQLGRAA